MPTGPPEPVESYVERIIRESIEAGDFDDLPGTGKPIPGAGTVDDPLWWVRKWVQRYREIDSGPQSANRSE